MKAYVLIHKSPFYTHWQWKVVCKKRKCNLCPLCSLFTPEAWCKWESEPWHIRTSSSYGPDSTAGQGHCVFPAKRAKCEIRGFLFKHWILVAWRYLKKSDCFPNSTLPWSRRLGRNFSSSKRLWWKMLFGSSIPCVCGHGRGQETWKMSFDATKV